jgi:hypothetical protein
MIAVSPPKTDGSSGPIVTVNGLGGRGALNCP